MAANLFHVIEGAQAILLSGGVFKQVKIYRRGKHIYAAHGGGFIRLENFNGTSHPRTTWREIDAGDNEHIEIDGNNAPKWKGK